MELAVIGDIEFEKIFDIVYAEDGYKVAQLNGKNCAFLCADDSLERKLKVIKKLGTGRVIEITEKDIDINQEEHIEDLGVEYSGFSIKGEGKYVKALIIDALVQNQDEKIISLSDREKEVLGLLAQGMSNKAIAQTLFLSEKTVKNHLNNVFKKIDVVDRTNAALYAVRNGL